jgi:O-6-methylguanine DNA methyltransferase
MKAMTARGFALFPTAIGHVGIAWGEGGVVGVQLPEGREAATRERALQRFGGVEEAPPPAVRRSIAAITALLRGEKTDLSAIPLDMDGVPPFHRRVYEVARAIPPGATLSYGEVAARMGAPAASRAVGQALGKNPFAIVVPCHRVLAKNGKMGGFSANGGVVTKQRLLSIEGYSTGASLPLFDFDPQAAIVHLKAKSPPLGMIIDRVGPFKLELKTSPSVFVALSEAIVYQQLHGKAAATIYGRLCALFSGGEPTPEGILRLPEAKLRGAGLSNSKFLSLRDLARRADAGEIPSLAEVRGMEDEAIIERLTEVRGIGRWTVEMLLIFRLGRPDVLPAFDFGVRKGFAHTFKKSEMPAPKELAKYGERWAPFRTVASWYFWRAAELSNLG